MVQLILAVAHPVVWDPSKKDYDFALGWDGNDGYYIAIGIGPFYQDDAEPYGEWELICKNRWYTLLEAWGYTFSEGTIVPLHASP